MCNAKKSNMSKLLPVEALLNEKATKQETREYFRR